MVGQLNHFFVAPQADGTNTTIVRPSGWNSAHSVALTIGGNTAGIASSLTGLTNVVLAGGSNVTIWATNDASSNATLSVIGQSAVDINSILGHTAGIAVFTSATQMVLAGGNNLTLSAATVGATVTLSLNGPQISYFNVGTAGSTSNASIGLSPGVCYFQQFELPTELVANRLNIYASQSMNMGSAASNAVSFTATWGSSSTLNAFLYSRGLGTSTGTLYSLWSTSIQLGMAFSISESGVSLSESYTITYPVSSGTSAFNSSGKCSTMTSAAGMSTMLATNIFSNVAEIVFPCITTIEAGAYFVGVQLLTASGTGLISASVFSTGQNGLGLSLVNNLQQLAGIPVQNFGSTNVVNNDMFQGLTMASTAATPGATIGITASMTSHSSGLFPAAFMNYALSTGINE